jgi:hypothetical protein
MLFLFFVIISLFFFSFFYLCSESSPSSAVSSVHPLIRKYAGYPNPIHVPAGFDYSSYPSLFSLMRRKSHHNPFYLHNNLSPFRNGFTRSTAGNLLRDKGSEGRETRIDASTSAGKGVMKVHALFPGLKGGVQAEREQTELRKDDKEELKTFACNVRAAFGHAVVPVGLFSVVFVSA